ncbi:hypothetical protein [Pseudoalteromonas sp.]|uniref:hypothetical protein n=1 Tax=Pseudoalteromonas sp. TaxID=53249 RepID=UPI003561D68B
MKTIELPSIDYSEALDRASYNLFDEIVSNENAKLLLEVLQLDDNCSMLAACQVIIGSARDSRSTFHYLINDFADYLDAYVEENGVYIPELQEFKLKIQ